MSGPVPAPSSHVSKRPGVMIVVVGPSGAGKDTLMDFAASRFEKHDGIHFVRRVITRSQDAGGENHDAVSEGEFARRLASGELCVSWQAHGLSYGIPAFVKDRLNRGETIIANGSRSALGQFKAAFSTMKVVNIVARLDVLAARLESRGRESREDILLRLQRSSLDVCGDFDVTTIDNSGALEASCTAFANLLEDHIRSGQ